MTYDINAMKESEPHDCSACKCPTCVHGPFYEEPCACGNNCDTCRQNNKTLCKQSCVSYKLPASNTDITHYI